jgi:hypothetical protein
MWFAWIGMALEGLQKNAQHRPQWVERGREFRESLILTKNRKLGANSKLGSQA